MTQGVILFAHGARDPRWADPFERMAARLAERMPAARVQLAYLEFMSPTLADAGRALAASGCTAIDLVPVFLGGGGHVRKDVPALAAELRAAHPGLRVTLHPALGEHALVIDAMAQAAHGLVHVP